MLSYFYLTKFYSGKEGRRHFSITENFSRQFWAILSKYMNKESPQQEGHEVGAPAIPPTVVDENKGLVQNLSKVDKTMSQTATILARLCDKSLP